MKNNDNLIPLRDAFKMHGYGEDDIDDIEQLVAITDGELNATDVISLIKSNIDEEIKWCINTDNQCKCEVTKEQTEWFIKGLKQAKILIDCVVDELLDN